MELQASADCPGPPDRMPLPLWGEAGYIHTCDLSPRLRQSGSPFFCVLVRLDHDHVLTTTSTIRSRTASTTTSLLALFSPPESSISTQSVGLLDLTIPYELRPTTTIRQDARVLRGSHRRSSTRATEEGGTGTGECRRERIEQRGFLIRAAKGRIAQWPRPECGQHSRPFASLDYPSW